MNTPKKSSKRRDATGHLDQAYERKLRAPSLSRRAATEPDDKAFVKQPRSAEPLAEPLAEQRGEAFVEAITSGEDGEAERGDRLDESETAASFVVSPPLPSAALGRGTRARHRR